MQYIEDNFGQTLAGMLMLTHEGRRYFHKKYNTLMDRFAWSILIPLSIAILISVFTNIAIPAWKGTGGIQPAASPTPITLVIQSANELVAQAVADGIPAVNIGADQTLVADAVVPVHIPAIPADTGAKSPATPGCQENRNLLLQYSCYPGALRAQAPVH